MTPAAFAATRTLCCPSRMASGPPDTTKGGEIDREKETESHAPSSTSILPVFTRQSAGTRAPADRSTRSPGTNSTASKSSLHSPREIPCSVAGRASSRSPESRERRETGAGEESGVPGVARCARNDGGEARGDRERGEEAGVGGTGLVESTVPRATSSMGCYDLRARETWRDNTGWSGEGGKQMPRLPPPLRSQTHDIRSLELT